MTIKITKQMITEAICGHLCGIAEGATKSYELTDKFVIIRDWDNGKPLRATWEIILKGYHCYGTDRIPEFISKDWNRSIKMFKKLKGL
jgi:hypothetical protein